MSSYRVIIVKEFDNHAGTKTYYISTVCIYIYSVSTKLYKMRVMTL